MRLLRVVAMREEAVERVEVVQAIMPRGQPLGLVERMVAPMGQPPIRMRRLIPTFSVARVGEDRIIPITKPVTAVMLIGVAVVAAVVAVRVMLFLQVEARGAARNWLEERVGRREVRLLGAMEAKSIADVRPPEAEGGLRMQQLLGTVALGDSRVVVAAVVGRLPMEVLRATAVMVALAKSGSSVGYKATRSNPWARSGCKGMRLDHAWYARSSVSAIKL